MVTRRNRLAWAVVVAACAGLATSSARAQVKVNDGRALDANTRVGSGGYNAQRPNLSLVTPNDLIYGNVSGGRAIRTSLVGDPTQPFGGRSGLEMDRFARAANAVSAPGAPPLPPGTYATPIYSSSPVGSPPSGFALNPYTGQYQAQDRIHAGLADIQYGVPPGTPILRPGADADTQLILSSTISDGTAGNGVPVTLTASPLLGIRALNGIADEDRFLLSRSSDGNLDPNVLRKLRSDMATQIAADPKLAEQFRRAEEQSALQQDATTASPKPLGAKSINGATPTGEALNGAGLPANPLTGPNPGFAPAAKYDPADHNPLLAALRQAEADRLAKATSKKPDAEKKPDDANRDVNPETKTPPPATQKAPDVDSKLGPRRDAPPTDTGPKTLGYIAPIKVGALSATAKQEGLKMLLEGNEKLLADGKYASAADRYEAATKFAPGDQMIVVARAQAELGAGFFARAESSLRSAVRIDPAVLGAQYDLNKILGEKRVSQLVSDLKRIALDDKTAVMPLTLLAYLAYNSGDEERALALLNEAHNRATADPLVKAMQSRWTPTANKP